jgi:hypothetical protein
VLVLCPEGPLRDALSADVVVDSHGGFGKDHGTVRTVRSAARASGAQIMHSHLAWAHLAWAAAKDTGRRAVVWTGTNRPPWRTFRRLNRRELLTNRHNVWGNIAWANPDARHLLVQTLIAGSGRRLAERSERAERAGRRVGSAVG